MKRLNIVSIVGILIFVVAMSGCTSSDSVNSSEPQFKQDIVIDGADYEYFSEDGSGGGGVWLTNEGDVTYTKVKINLEVFDNEGNSIANQTIVIGKIGPGESINYAAAEGYDPLPDGVSARGTVINATVSE